MNTTSVSSDFGETTALLHGFSGRLRAIRDEGDKANVRQQKRRTEEELRRTDRLLASHDFLAQAETIVHEFAEPFLGEAPRFAATRRLYDGCYELSLQARELLADRAGRPDRYISRITFLLDPHADDGSFTLRTRMTVDNRDLASDFLSVEMTDDTALTDLRTHIEARFLAFAAAYFDRSELTPLPTPSNDGIAGMS